MKNAAKVAVSIPAKTLRRLESARKSLGRNRSSIVTEAVERWLDEQEGGTADHRYVEAYLAVPESTGEGAAVAAAVVSGWEPWE